MLKGLTQKLRVHQYHDSAQPHDAVTNQMRFLKRALREIGITGEIFARHVKPAGWSEVRAFSTNSMWDCDLLLVHHSQGSPLLGDVMKIEVPKALVYHNITPGHFFRHDPYIEGLCHTGRHQLLRLRGEVVAAFVDSRFNGWELEELGYRRPEILPLFELRGETIPAREERPPRRLLFVGKITPHKNQALLVKTLFYLKGIWGNRAHLCLVGGEDPVYGRYVRQLVKVLDLEENVTFAGRLDDDGLAREYAAADAFVSTSLHEGFGIPLVEAMRFGAPVFALPCGAVPETLGDSGVQLLSQKPHRIAETLAEILKEPRAIEAIAESQRLRLADIARRQNLKTAQEKLAHLLASLRKISLPEKSAPEITDATT